MVPKNKSPAEEDGETVKLIDVRAELIGGIIEVEAEFVTWEEVEKNYNIRYLPGKSPARN
jgi:hypothetical protein